MGIDCVPWDSHPGQHFDSGLFGAPLLCLNASKASRDTCSWLTHSTTRAIEDCGTCHHAEGGSQAASLPLAGSGVGAGARQ